MGIINATPDSFFAESRASGSEAVDRALAMVDEGAAIIDVGGESSRPGAEIVPESVEIDRVLPVIESVRAQTDAWISVDTTKPGVASAAVDAGADLINDINGLTHPDMVRVVSDTGVAAVVMHMQGSPRDMQRDPRYDDVVTEVVGFLRRRVTALSDVGIAAQRLLIDPGIGFGKRLEDNLDLIAALPGLREIGLPVLLGVSRKSFIGTVTGAEVTDRAIGTAAVHAIALATGGVDVLRVHDVVDTRSVLALVQAIDERRSVLETRGPEV